MQEMTPTIAANTSDGATAILTDTRDNQTYTVAKINGNVWMTENLNLAGGTTLIDTTSNVVSNYTLPVSSTIGFTDSDTAYVYNSGRTDCTSPGCYSYYSYVAAVAGANPSSGKALSDICPKGWQLPTQTEFLALGSTYPTGEMLTASPFLAVYGGIYNSNSAFEGGRVRGDYWSSVAYSTTQAYTIYIDRDGNSTDHRNKNIGRSVRCTSKI